MTIENDIIYGEKLNPRVLTVSTADDYKLILTFTNGEQRIFDAKPLLSTDAFKPLKNKSFFETVKVAYGSIEWPHDIDYCADTLYIESTPVQ